jgi:hypothetical protein
MDKPTIHQHTTPRAARQGAADGASFSGFSSPGAVIQAACYGLAYGMGAKRFAEGQD